MSLLAYHVANHWCNFKEWSSKLRLKAKSLELLRLLTFMSKATISIQLRKSLKCDTPRQPTIKDPCIKILKEWLHVLTWLCVAMCHIKYFMKFFKGLNFINLILSKFVEFKYLDTNYTVATVVFHPYFWDNFSLLSSYF